MINITVARAPSFVSLLICSVSIVFIHMICHGQPALMGVYPPWQPVSVSFFSVVIVIVVNLTNKFFFFFFWRLS